MDVDNSQQQEETRQQNEFVEFFKERIETFGSQISDLLKEVDGKNRLIEEANQNYFNILKGTVSAISAGSGVCDRLSISPDRE